jgi:hypothetical protein
MRPYFRILIGLIVIWLGIKAVQIEFGGYELGLLYHLQKIAFLFLIIFTIAAFVLDMTYYKLDNKIIQFTVSFIGVIFCTIVVYKIIQRESIDNSKTILTVSNKAGATNVMTFEFKDNKHFRLTEYDRLGQTVFYGKFSKQQDTLKLLESNYEGHVKKLPMTGIINLDTVYWNGFDTMVIDKE